LNGSKTCRINVMYSGLMKVPTQRVVRLLSSLIRGFY